MLTIAGRPVNPEELLASWNLTPVQSEMIFKMAQSLDPYHYRDDEELKFELNVRQEIVEAAKAMSYSGARFADFEHSYCNPMYWSLQPNGGFLLNPGVKPSIAIRDIFTNGHAYAFECAVAMIIIYYKALLEILGEQIFDELFANLYLWSWHQDTDLGLVTRLYNLFIPGDVVYFDNPDVHPKHIESQGENAVVLENNLFFGHGIGIATARQIIQKLNSLRKPFSFRSAYLMDQATRPNFRYLMNYTTSYRFSLREITIIGKIGDNTHFR